MRAMLKLMFLVVFSVTAFNTQAGITDSLEKSKVVTRLKQEVADLDVKFKLDFLDIDLFEGISLSNRYRYEVEPSYEAQFYSRIDDWSLKTNINVGDIIESSSPVYFNMNREAHVKFVRQFKSQKEALKALPYTLAQLPLTSKMASKLEVGDFVSLPATLSVVVGAKTNLGLTDVPVEGKIYYLVSGQFIVNVFRMANNRVRLKLIADRGREGGLTGKAGVDFEIAGVRVVDRAIERILDLNLFESNASKGVRHQFILDYIFDLNDQDARKAYDKILSSTYKFKDLSIFADNFNSGNLEKTMISTFEGADNLAMADLGEDNRRVDRLFKGLNDYKIKKSNLKLGLILASFKKNNSFKKSTITYEDETGERRRYYYPVYTRYKQSKLRTWPFKFKEETETQLFGLVPVDEENLGDHYTDFGLNYWRKDKNFSGEEQAKVHQILIDNLPTTLYKNIDWDQWKEFDRKRNARIFFQVIFKGDAFEKIENLTYAQVETRMLAYLKERKRLYAGKIGGVLTQIWRRFRNLVRINKMEAKRLAKKIHAITSDKGLKGKEKIEKILDLNDQTIFRQMGVGFLASLLEDKDLNDSVYFEFKLMATDVEPLEIKFGERPFSDIYNELLQIHSAINDRSYDMRVKGPKIQLH